MSETEETKPELTSAEWDVWRTMRSMHEQLARELDRHLQSDAGISGAEYSVLQVLTQVPDRRLRTGELAELLAWEKSRVSHQIARMEARGLLTRTECDTDARGVWVGMTPDGRRTWLTATRGHAAMIRKLFFDSVRAEELPALDALSRRVLDSLNPAACDLAEEKGMLPRTSRTA
ncbi:MAG TPA: MarR family winged helix-turn-helix transcriptional regulator [Pseudolysinimonas sp.]|nr:MarR family winged helix-turn-helix transcriptional regulator [Pseudolysinimonas sp.]